MVPRDMSEIVGVRYTTMFGDPGREFLKSSLVATHVGGGGGYCNTQEIFERRFPPFFEAEAR